MKILYIVPNPPSLVRVRPFNLIRGLLARGHELTVATVWRNAEERHDLEALRALGAQILAAHLTSPQIARNLLNAAVGGLPLQARYAYSPELAGKLRTAAASDLVHIEHLRGTAYLPAVAGAGIPRFWDAVDCISHLFGQTVTSSRSRRGRWMARLELGRTRRYEAQMLGRFHHTVVTSPMDQAALARLSTLPEPALSVLPNGVDLTYFSPQGRAPEPSTVVFTGKMSYHANITAALYLVDEIMPQVWARKSDVRVVLAGKDPAPAVQALAQAHAPRVTVTGSVADLRPSLWQATVAVAPMPYSAGIQNKVLEAMACGTPAIASPQAVSALSAAPGEHLLVAEGTEAFAEAILQVLADPGLQTRLSGGGREYVETYHDWNTIAGQLEAIYSLLLQAHADGSPAGHQTSETDTHAR